jgi:DAK2 domain fusion protein YloV
MSPPFESLSGPELRDLFAAATAWLERNVPQVNAVNVYPVPDGDTGTNMFLTMRSTMEEAERCEEESAGAIVAAMSHGALMGARGNSGVILSQIIGGLAKGVDGADAFTPPLLVAGLENAAAAAYKAVTKPAEGTILTVIREVSEAAAGANAPDIASLLELAVSEAKASVQRTPSLLPVLAEAGVVDAGGLGLSVLLDGMLRHLRGEALDDAASAETVEQGWLEATGARHDTEDSLYGYCTEVLISAVGVDVDAFRERVLTLGDSVIVVGDPELVRVHVHTDDPGAALTLGTEVGQLVQVKVDNIRKQAERFVDMHEQRQGAGVAADAPLLSTVAIVAGEGMARVFESVGCTRTISGGPTMNPSTREIVEAVDGCPSEDVAVLPNDKNIILAAQQARDLTKKRLHVIGTRSMPQGIAALLAANPEEADAETNVRAMEEAREGIRTIEVTRSVRTTSIGGVRVAEGDVIAIVDDELKLAAASPEEAVLAALKDVDGHGSLVTLYYGNTTEKAAAEELARNIKRLYASYDVEVVFGGQPHYDYIASVE